MTVPQKTENPSISNSNYASLGNKGYSVLPQGQFLNHVYFSFIHNKYSNNILPCLNQGNGGTEPVGIFVKT